MSRAEQILNQFSEADFSSEVAKIAKMTDRNDHDGARIAGAKLLKSDYFESIFKAIQDIAKIERSLPSELSSYRYRKEKDMFKFAKSRLSDDEYTEFHSAF